MKRDHIIIDKLQNAEHYYDMHPAFEKAFAFLKRNDLAELPADRYEINGDRLRICYAETSPKRPTKFESNGHDNLFECERISKEPIPIPQK